MDFMSGLEKFGFDSSEMGDIFADENEGSSVKRVEVQKKEKEELKETDFLFDKSYTCVVCDKEFKSRTVKSSKVRRIGADKDLRPKYMYIDPLKYEVVSCPYCGYSATNKYFGHLSTLQIKLVKDGVCSKFQPAEETDNEVYSYAKALVRYKLSLFCTVAKKGKTSEKAYTLLKMSWLCRGQAEELVKNGAAADSEEVKTIKKEERYFYEQAYEGLTKAVATENFPMCGMDQNTMDLLLAQMSVVLGKYEIASKLVSRLLVSSTVTSNVREKAYDLKQELIAILRANK